MNGIIVKRMNDKVKTTKNGSLNNLWKSIVGIGAKEEEIFFTIFNNNEEAFWNVVDLFIEINKNNLKQI